jgi:hypothetical protein
MDPKPAQGHTQAGTDAYQKIDMSDAPDPPCEHSPQLDPAKVYDRLAFANLRLAPVMVIPERTARRPSGEGGHERRWRHNVLPALQLEQCLVLVGR